MLSNIKIIYKLLAGFLLMIALLFAAVMFANWGLNTIREADASALKRQTDAGHLWAMKFYLVEQYQHLADLIINGK